MSDYPQSNNIQTQSAWSYCTLGLALLVTFPVSSSAGTPNYLRGSLQYSVEISYPKFAGVPQLTNPPVGEIPKYYSKLRFSGGSEHARGPLASAGAGGISRQSRTVLSGDIVYAYDVTTDQVIWSNGTLLQSGEILGVPPWDPATTDWPQPPVLTVDVPVGGGVPINYGEWYISANNPLGLNVRSATKATDDDVFHGGVFGGNSLDPVEWRDFRMMELTDEDTQEMAENRAKVTKLPAVTDRNLAYTIRGTPLNGIPWTIRKVHVTSRFEACQVCSGGLYEQRRVFQRRTIGASEWMDWRTDTKTVRIKEAKQLVEESFEIPLEIGYEVRLADLTYEAVGSDCTACGDGNGLAGGANGATPGSIRWHMPLGSTPNGDSAGFLTLYSERITPALYTPSALQASVAAGEALVLRDAQNNVRQVLAPQALVDVVTTGTDSYEIRLYARTAVSGPGGDGLYSASGSAYQVWRIDRPGVGLWRQTRIIQGQQLITLVDESTPGLRVFSEAGGLRITETTESTDNGDRVETVVVKNSSGVIATSLKTWYRSFAWGEERVKEVRDPAGAALTTEWTYVTDPNSGAYRKVATVKRPDGYMESNVYNGDASGRIVNTLQPFWRNDTKTTSYETSFADLNNDGYFDYRSTETEGVFLSLLGVTHYIAWGGDTTLGGIKYQLRESRRAPTGGAWDNAANIITRYRLYADGPHAGELAYRLNPDGTLFLRRFVSNIDGGTTIIEENGAADLAGEAVVDGTRSTRTLSARGFLVALSVTDIVTGRLLESQNVSQTDDFGRPLRILHTDGAEEVRSYCALCGSITQVSLRGQTVTYDYDDLGRKILETHSAGATVQSQTRFEYDAADRLTKTYRVNPADATETLLSSTTYDLAGRVLEVFSLGTGTTVFSHAFGPNNSTVTTTTYADGGTRVETRAPSGQVYKISGTAVTPVEYDWGHREWWGGGTGYLARTHRFYDPVNFVTETSLIDLLGNIADTSYPDGAVTRRYFDGIGRLAREVDADGVTTLYTYDAHGRPAVTATDLNGNTTIDYAGTDRLTRTLYEVGVHDGHTVRRTVTQIWETDGQDTPSNVAVSEQSADGLRSWQTVRGLTTATVTNFDGVGGRTVISTAPDGTMTTQTYFGDRLQSTVTSHPSLGTLASTSHAYDALGRLIQSTDTRTGTTTYAYDAGDRLHAVTTPDPDPARSGPGYDPQVTTYGYDALGRTTTITQPDGGVVTTEYFPTGQVKKTFGARTYPAAYTYDIQNRIKTLTTWQDYANATGAAVTTWNYDSTRGWLTDKRYNDNTGPSYLYKPSGRLQRRTWARGVQTTYTYNAAGDLAGVTYTDGTPTVSISYDRAGRPRTIIDGSGTRTLAYDPISGQLQNEDYTAGLLNTLGVHRSFDSLSRLDSLSTLPGTPPPGGGGGGSALSQVGYAYDAASRLQTVTAGSNTATYSYMPSSSLVQTITLAQAGTTRLTTTKAYDNLNRLTAISSTLSASPSLSHAYAYNAANQRTRATREDNAYWQYQYDPLGQVVSGKKLDAANAAIPGHDFAWTYDDIGNRRSASRNASSPAILAKEDYTSNLLNQYIQRTIPGKFDLLAAAEPDATVTYQYPADSSRPVPLPLYGKLRYAQLTADNSGGSFAGTVKVTGVKNNVGPAGEDAVTEITRGVFLPQTPERFTYDADGNLTGDAKWTYTWDGENRLSRMETKASALVAGISGGLLGKYYNYTAGTVWSGPPALTRVEAVDFDWGEGSPGAGVGADQFNVLWTGAVEAPVTGDYLFETQSDDGAELWLNGTVLFSNWGLRNGVSTLTSGAIHLEAGQRYPIVVYYFNASGPAVMRLRWRKPGEAVLQAIPAENLYHQSADQAPRRLELAYDYQGRRVAKKVSVETNAEWTVQSDLRHLYDGWNLLAELNATDSNAPVRTYVWGLDLSGSLHGAGGVGGLLFVTVSAAPGSPLTAHSACYDGNGNVIGYVDMATGAKSATYEYSAFGETLIADGPTVELFPFRFSTKYTDDETNLLYYGLRYYSPNTGRWICRDPAEEFADGPNVFSFVKNSPLTEIDYLGLWSVSEHYDIIGQWLDSRSSQLPKGSTYERYEWRCGVFINIKSALQQGNDMIDGTGAYFLDGFYSAQHVDNSYLHAMRAPNQSKTEARNAMYNFVFERLRAARASAERANEFYDAGNMSAAQSAITTAVVILGQAQHPIADNTSPQHYDFQIWRGMFSPSAISEARKHHKSENRAEYEDQHQQPFIAVKGFFDPSLSEILK